MNVRQRCSELYFEEVGIGNGISLLYGHTAVQARVTRQKNRPVLQTWQLCHKTKSLLET